METLLYQFAISHYCEKARWALDHKKVAYQIKNLLPGLHILALRGKVEDTSLPVLRINGKYIQGSDQIIDVLEQIITAYPLTPTNPMQRDDAQYWESFATTELAAPYGVFYYSHMLEYPHLLRQRYSQNGPWYTPFFFALTFNRICQRLREMYNITNSSANQARERIEAALQKLQQHLQSRTYLVGNQFSRADLSVAALLSPLARPAQMATYRSNVYPDVINEFQAQFDGSSVMQWVRQIYQTHRNEQ